jgi:hypothetical protein
VDISIKALLRKHARNAFVFSNTCKKFVRKADSLSKYRLCAGDFRGGNILLGPYFHRKSYSGKWTSLEPFSTLRRQISSWEGCKSPCPPALHVEKFEGSSVMMIMKEKRKPATSFQPG